VTQVAIVALVYINTFVLPSYFISETSAILPHRDVILPRVKTPATTAEPDQSGHNFSGVLQIRARPKIAG
jgi:hypothetical protein